METQTTENISGSDRVTRTLVGATLVGLTLVLTLSPAVIAVLCLLAAYPLVTTLIGWDPIVAAANIIDRQIHAVGTTKPV